jgi:cbb3-type cytochrome oxidase maturation protein
MDIVFVLVPLALALVGLIVWVFMWAVRSNQFDDLEGPAHQILMDEDEPKWAQPKPDTGEATEDVQKKTE